MRRRRWLSGSSGVLLFLVATASLKLRGKPVEAPLPHAPIALHPLVQVPEGPRAQLVETPPPLGAYEHEVGILQDSELTRHTGLTDVHDVDELAHRTLSLTQRLDQASAGRIGQDLEGVCHGPHITSRTYVVSTICRELSAIAQPKVRSRITFFSALSSTASSVSSSFDVNRSATLRR